MVIGDPIAHSRSPGIQNAAFEYYHLGSPYGIRHVRPAELPEFIKFARANLKGANLTIPHKSMVIPLLDSIDPAAEIAGSVNTLIIENGRIHGTSTDGYGLEQALIENFHRPVAGANVTFIGAGGAAHATAFHLAAVGVKSIRIANRTIAKAEEIANKLRTFYPELAVEIAQPNDSAILARWFADTDFLIQATSLGLQENDPPPFDLSLLTPELKLCVFDTIYRQTSLLKRALELGLPAVNGEAMLIHQGAKSFELWTGLAAPLEAMRRGFGEKKLC